MHSLLKFQVYKLLVMVLLFSQYPDIGLSEVYRCNGVWSTKPCSENATPVELKRQLSFSGDSKVEAVEHGESAALAEQETPVADSESLKGCEPVPNGITIRISDASVAVRRLYDSLSATFRVTVKNESTSRSSEGPIYADINTSSGKRFRRRLFSSVGPGQLQRGTFSLHGRYSEGGYLLKDSFAIQLVYSPAARCSTFTVRSKFEGDDGKDSTGLFSSSQDLRKILLNMREQVRRELQNTRGSTRHNDHKRATEQRYRLELMRLCGVSTKELRNSAVDSLCLELKEMVGRICQ